MPSKAAKGGGKAPKVSGSKMVTDTPVDEGGDYNRGKQVLKPDDQLELLEKDLNEEVTRVLATKNTQMPDNLVEYNYYKGAWVNKALPGDTILLVQLDGTSLEIGGPEHRAQLIAQGKDPGGFLEEAEEGEGEEEEAAPVAAEVAPPPPVEEEVLSEEEVEEEEEEEEGGGEAEAAAKDDEDEEGGDSKPKKKMNQFNFCERAALTYSNPSRTAEAQTIPPPRASYSNQCYQWLIFDIYAADFAEQHKDTGKVLFTKTKKKTCKKKVISPAEIMQKILFKNWNILERMCNLNTFDEITSDCRYWEDPSDEFRDGEGTLLPLWKFGFDKVKKMTVTDLCWNPWYYDLFAVSFGSFDFTIIPDEGYLCLFTLKNPSYPETVCVTDSGVMCVDVHPKFPYFVAIGLYDGNVMVYNVQQSSKEPQFRSNTITQKHSGIVWEIQWALDLPDGELNFFSVAGDGRVNQWVLQITTLIVTTVIHLYMDLPPVAGPDGTTIRMKGCGSALRLHPASTLLYLVGTEEGLVYKCSTQYSALYMTIYPAHDMPVYRIDFNKFNSSVFATCSGDWRVKVWEETSTDPLFSFDLGTAVGDVRWAPYSSTVFAAVTNDGKVHVFDLNVNKYSPICTQNIVNRKKNKLTRIAFNTKLSVILVGDDKGTVTSLKLSPNLRVMCKATKKQGNLDQVTLQNMKLDKLLSLMREPKVLQRPPDVEEED